MITLKTDSFDEFQEAVGGKSGVVASYVTNPLASLAAAFTFSSPAKTPETLFEELDIVKATAFAEVQRRAERINALVLATTNTPATSMPVQMEAEDLSDFQKDVERSNASPELINQYNQKAEALIRANKALKRDIALHEKKRSPKNLTQLKLSLRAVKEAQQAYNKEKIELLTVMPAKSPLVVNAEQKSVPLDRRAEAKKMFFGLQDPDALDVLHISDEALKQLVVTSPGAKEPDGGLIALNLAYYTELYAQIQEKIKTLAADDPETVQKHEMLTKASAYAHDQITDLRKLQGVFCGILMHKTQEAVMQDSNAYSASQTKRVLSKHMKYHPNSDFKLAVGRFNNSVMAITNPVVGLVIDLRNKFDKYMQKRREAKEIKEQDKAKIIADIKEIVVDLKENHESKKGADNLGALVELFSKSAAINDSINKILKSDSSLSSSLLDSKKTNAVIAVKLYHAIYQMCVTEHIISEVNALSSDEYKTLVSLMKDNSLLNEVCANADLIPDNSLTAKEYQTLNELTQEKKANLGPTQYAHVLQSTGIAYQIINYRPEDILDENTHIAALKELNVENLDQWFEEMEYQANDQQKEALRIVKGIIRGDQEILSQYPVPETFPNKPLSDLALQLSKLFPDAKDKDDHVNKSRGAALLEAVIYKFVLPRSAGEPQEFLNQYAGLQAYVAHRKGLVKVAGFQGETYETTKKQLGLTQDFDTSQVAEGVASQAENFLKRVLNAKNPVNDNADVSSAHIDQAWHAMNKANVPSIINSIGFAAFSCATTYKGEQAINGRQLEVLTKYDDFILNGHNKSKIPKESPYATLRKDANGKDVSSQLYVMAEKRFEAIKIQVISGQGVMLYPPEMAIFAKVKFSIKDDLKAYRKKSPFIIRNLSAIALMACDNVTISRVFSEKIDIYFSGASGNKDYKSYGFNDKEVEKIRHLSNAGVKLEVDKSRGNDFYLAGDLLDRSKYIFIFNCDDESLKKAYVDKLLNDEKKYKHIPAEVVEQCFIHNKGRCEKYLEQSIANMKGGLPTYNFISFLSKSEKSNTVIDFIMTCLKAGNIAPLLQDQFAPSCEPVAALPQEFKTLINENIKLLITTIYDHPDLIDKLGKVSKELHAKLKEWLFIEVIRHGLHADEYVGEKQMEVIFGMIDSSSNKAEKASGMLGRILKDAEKFFAKDNSALIIDKFPIKFYEKFCDKLEGMSGVNNGDIAKLRGYIEYAKIIADNTKINQFSDAIWGGAPKDSIDIYLNLLGDISNKRYQAAHADNQDNASRRSSDAGDERKTSFNEKTLGLPKVEAVLASLPHLERSRIQIERTMVDAFYSMDSTTRDGFIAALRNKNTGEKKLYEQLLLKIQESAKTNDPNLPALLTQLNDTVREHGVWRQDHVDDLIEKLTAIDAMIKSSPIEKMSLRLESMIFGEIVAEDVFDALFTVEKMKNAIAVLGPNQDKKEEVLINIEKVIENLNKKPDLTELEYHQKHRLLVFYHMLVKDQVHAVPYDMMLDNKTLSWLLRVSTLEDQFNALSGTTAELLSTEARGALEKTYETYLTEDMPVVSRDSIAVRQSMLMLDNTGFNPQRSCEYLGKMHDKFNRAQDEAQKKSISSSTASLLLTTPSVAASTTENIALTIKDTFEVYLEAQTTFTDKEAAKNLVKLLKERLLESFDTRAKNLEQIKGAVDTSDLQAVLGLEFAPNQALSSAIDTITNPVELGKIYSIARVCAAAEHYAPTISVDGAKLSAVLTQESANRPREDGWLGTSTFQKRAAESIDLLPSTAKAFAPK